MIDAPTIPRVSRPLRLPGRCLLALTLLLAFAAPWNARAADCDGVGGIATCRQQLARDPGNIDLRFALADAFNRLKRHKEAVAVLQQGLAFKPGDEELRHRLSLAKSLLEEQEWIQKKHSALQPSARVEQQDTETKLNIIRCKSLKGGPALKACDAGLKRLPDNVTLLIGKADALLDLKRIPPAITAYRQALRQEPHNALARSKLQIAEAKRQALVAKCMKRSGEAGLAACEEGFLKGAKDQAAIDARRGDILLAMNQPSRALKAYRAAHALDSRNRHVRHAIAKLTEPVPAAQKHPQMAQAKKTAPPQPSQIDRSRGAVTNVAATGRSAFGNAALSPGVTY
jgi:tetratricopeptide (TPR) repeat protein